MHYHQMPLQAAQQMVIACTRPEDQLSYIPQVISGVPFLEMGYKIDPSLMKHHATI